MREPSENMFKPVEKPKENQIQPWPFKSNFQKEKISKEGERNMISSENAAIMNTMIAETVKLFENSQIDWAVDGGLSISILKGEFIGEHRDLDLAVEANQLESLEKLIESKGHSLFVTLKDAQGEKIMKRVDWKEFLTAKTFIYWIIAVDENGIIQKDKPLSFINIHIIRRNEDGTPIDECGSALPKEWLYPKTVRYNGQEVKIANPAKTAYYKFMSFREYDVFDLKHLAKTKEISPEDLQIIDYLFKNRESEKDKQLYPARKEVIEEMKRILES